MHFSSTHSRPRRARRVRARLMLVTALLVSASQGPVIAKEYVRWVDENGVVHIGHSVPPEYKDQEVETLNDQGVVTGKVPRAPTADERAQMEMEAEIEAARAELSRRQAEYRENLFKSYATVGDLEAYHRSRMDALYYRESMNDRKVRELREKLRELMGQAKEFNFPYSAESSLPAVPEELLVELQATNQALGERQADAENLRRKLIEQERKFESDLEIYRKYAASGSIAQDRAGASR